MPAINQTYLVDTTGQQWQLAVDELGEPSTTPVFGQAAVPNILIHDSVTAQVWSLTIVPTPPPMGMFWGQIRIDVVPQTTSVTKILLSSPGGKLFNLSVVSGLLSTAPGTAPPPPVPIPSDQPSGQFNVVRLTAQASYTGGISSYILPCAGGDTITFTASIRWLSGPHRPTIGIWFWDAAMATNFGSIQISPPNTDVGWHNYSTTAIAPAGAAVMVVATVPEPLINNQDFFVGFMADADGPYGPASAIASIPDMWEISNFRITQNGNALYAPINTFSPNTVLGALNGVVVLTLGTNYRVGDIITVLQAGAAGGSVTVLTVDGSGGVTGISANSNGYGYSVAASLPTSSPHGTGVLVQVVAVQNIAVPPAVVEYLQEFIFPLYYLSLLTSQYQNAPNLYAWLSVLLTPGIDLFNCMQQLYQAFNVTTATGVQLDTIGDVVGAKRVLPIQPTSLNLVRYSQGAFNNNPPWVPFNLTITDNVITDPHGGTTASKLIGITSDCAIDQIIQSSNVGGRQVTLSFYAKVPSGTPTINFYIMNQSSVVRASAPAALTTSWQRFSLTVTMNVLDTGANIQIGGAASFGVIEVDLWGVQFEFAATASAYINSTISPVLTDTDYRLLVRATIFRNQWDGRIGSIYAIWNQLFPGGFIEIFDNQDMTATIILAGEFTPIAQDMILHDLIVPRPEGVQYNFSFVTLPVLGFDQVNANVAGLDLGHFA